MPASDSATLTLTLAGKPRTAPRASPAYSRIGSLIPEMSMPCSTSKGAPSKPAIGLRVTRVTEWIVPSRAALTASRPSSAPRGTTICPPCARARSISSGASSNAPALSTTRRRSRRSAGSPMARSSFDGAHSTTQSQRSAKASKSTQSTRLDKCSPIHWPAAEGSRAVTASSANPGSWPASSARASALPMVPRPAMPRR